MQAITFQQMLDHFAAYDPQRVTFQFADGLPVVIAYVQTDDHGAALVTLSDEIPEPDEAEPQLQRMPLEASPAANAPQS